MNRFIFTGRSLPFVRLEGIWTGCFFFQAAKVIGPSGVSIIRSSVESVKDWLPEMRVERKSQIGADYPRNALNAQAGATFR